MKFTVFVCKGGRVKQKDFDDYGKAQVYISLGLVFGWKLVKIDVHPV